MANNAHPRAWGWFFFIVLSFSIAITLLLCFIFEGSKTLSSFNETPISTVLMAASTFTAFCSAEISRISQVVRTKGDSRQQPAITFGHKVKTALGIVVRSVITIAPVFVLLSGEPTNTLLAYVLLTIVINVMSIIRGIWFNH